MDILRVVAHTEWGGGRTVLLQLYQALIRSKLDYGCMAYGSAHPSYIKKLNPIQNQGLRLPLELPLDLRREKLSLQYAMKVAANPLNPAYQCVFENEYTEIFEGKPNAKYLHLAFAFEIHLMRLPLIEI